MAKVTEEIELKLNDESLDEELSKISSSAKQADESLASMQKSLDKVGKGSNAIKAGVGVTKEFRDAIENLKTSFQRLHETQAQTAKLSTIDTMTTQANELRNKLQEVENKYAEAFKAKDYSGIRQIGGELDNLREKAREYAETLRSAQSQGISINTESDELDEFRTRINTVAQDAGTTLRDHLKNGIKQGLSQISSLVKKSISTTLNFGKQAVSKYFGMLKSGFTSLFSYIRKQFSGIGNFGKNAFGGLGNIFSQLKGILGVVGIGYLVKSMYQLSDAAINMEGTMSNVFGDMTDDIRSWSDEFADRFTLTIEQARSFATSFGTIFGNLGISGEAQAEMSKNMAALTGDIASYYGKTTEESSKMIEQAIAGNVRSFKQLGIVMNDTVLNEYAMARGYNQTYTQMNETNKAILRYNYLLSQTTAMQGNASASAGTWTNQIRMLKANFQSLGSLLGGALIKLLYPVVTVLNQIVSSAVNAMNALAKLLGFDPVSISELTGVGGGGAPDIEDVSDALDDEADAIDGVGKASKNAAENLQGFDKLNNMTSQSASGASDKGAGAGLGGLIDFDSYYKNVDDLEDSPLKKYLDELWQLLADKKWKDAGKHIAEGVNSLVDMLYKALTDKKLYNGIDNFSDAITDFYDGLLDIDVEKIGMTLGAGFNLITYAINKLYEDAASKDLLKRTGAKIADFFLGLDKEVDFKQAGKAFATGFRVMMDVARGFFDQAEANDLARKIGTDIREFISGAAERAFDNGGAEEIGKNIASAINFALELVASLIGDGSEVDKIGDAIVTILNTAINNISAEDLTSAVSGVLNLIGKLFSKVGEIDVDQLSDKIAGAINGVADNGSLENAASGLATAFLKIVELIGDVITKVDWDNVGDAILSGIADSIKNNPEGKKYFQNALALIFTAQLVGGALQLGLNALGKAIIEALATKIAGSKLLGGAIGQAVTNGTAEATASASTAGGSVGTAFATGFKAVAVVAVAAMAAELVDGFRSTINQKMAEINYNEESSIPQLTVNVDTTSLDDYLESLARLQREYGTLTGDIDSARGYLETLRKEGYENTEQFKALDSAINNYDNSGLFGRQKALDEVYKAAGNVQAGINQTTLALSQLDEQSFDNLSNNFGQLTVGATYTLEELQRIADEAGEAGKETGENYVTELKDLLGDSDCGQDFSELIANSVPAAQAEAERAGTTVGQSYLDPFEAQILNDKSIQNAEVSNVAVAGQLSNLEANRQGNLVGTGFVSNVATTVNSDISVQNATRQNMSLAGQGANTVAITQGQTTGRSYTSNVATTVSADTSVATSLTNKVSSAASQASATAGGKGKEIGGNIVDGVAAGVNDDSKHSKIADAVGSLCSKIVDWFKSKLSIHSPSKVFADLAGFIPSGVAVGIEDNEDVALDAVKSFSDDIVSKFNLETVDVSEMIDVQGIDDVMSVARDKISSSLTGLTSTVGVQSDMVVQPKFKQTELDALTAQDASNSILEQKLTNMASRLGMNQGSKMMNVSVYLDASNKLADFVINTQNGQVVKGGAF